MPELPEVETIARRLRTILLDREIAQVDVLHPKSFLGSGDQITGHRIIGVDRKAKQLYLVLDQDLGILVHLKMTGQLIVVAGDQRVGGGHPTADWVNSLPSKHTRAVITFADGATLFFNDQRIFGWLKVIPKSEVAALWADLPFDINAPEARAEDLAVKLARKKVAIKIALLDSKVVGGLGNIYVCDALNVARIHPERPASSLSPAEVTRLFEAAQLVIKEGIALGGTTFDGSYVNVDGFAGRYQTVARVYARAGQACPNCGSPITKTRQLGRGTYWCPECQR